MPLTEDVSDVPLDHRERLALCEAFLELGPEAPTLCDGWSAADLAAHLVVRERDPRSAPGILAGGPFERYTERLMARERERGFEAMVERIRSGPPLVPWRLPGLRELLNLQEYFVHHEDLRRANGRGRRTDADGVEDGIWRILRRAAAFQLRKVGGVGVELARPEGDVVRARKGTPVGRLTGHPGELVLYLTGRKAHAEVEVSGDPEAVRRIEQAQLRI